MQEEISVSLNIVRMKLGINGFKFQDLLDGKDDKIVYRRTNAVGHHPGRFYRRSSGRYQINPSEI